MHRQGSLYRRIDKSRNAFLCWPSSCLTNCQRRWGSYTFKEFLVAVKSIILARPLYILSVNFLITLLLQLWRVNHKTILLVNCVYCVLKFDKVCHSLDVVNPTTFGKKWRRYKVKGIFLSQILHNIRNFHPKRGVTRDLTTPAHHFSTENNLIYFWLYKTRWVKDETSIWYYIF